MAAIHPPSGHHASAQYRPLSRLQAIDPNAVNQLRQIGKGGNGRCYLVRRIRDKQILVKKVNKDIESTRMERKLLEHILPVHRRIVSLEPGSRSPKDGALYFEYCPGGDLGHLNAMFKKEDRLIPEAFVWHVFLRLAEALAFIHYGYNKQYPNELDAKWLTVVHRDVKPQNVFLRTVYSDQPPFASIILGDFGAATLEPRSNCYTTLMYQPPELPRCTTRGDVWGMGAIIHSLIHGKEPFKMPTDLQLLLAGGMQGWAKRAISHVPEKATTWYSEGLNKDMMDALALRPERRPTSLEMFKRLNARHVNS